MSTSAKYSATSLAYAAGIIDGEGYIGIKRSKAYACQGRKTPGYNVRIQVRMTDRQPLDLLSSLFGGPVRFERPQLLTRRALFAWQITDAKAESAIRLLLPLLLVKRKQAKRLLVLRRLKKRGRYHRTKIIGYRNFPNSYGTLRKVANRSYSDQFVAWCDKLWWDCRKLNGWAVLESVP